MADIEKRAYLGIDALCRHAGAKLGELLISQKIMTIVSLRFRAHECCGVSFRNHAII